MNLPLNYTHENFVKRAMLNAKPHCCGESPRWVAVMDTFATGSTVARDLCDYYGLDPDEKINGATCVSCNP